MSYEPVLVLRVTPVQSLVAAISGNLHLLETPCLSTAGMGRATIAVSTCAAIATEAPELLRQSSGTTVLAADRYVVRVAEANRSSLDVTQLTDAALALRTFSVPTPEPLARLVISDADRDDSGSATWEVSVWRRYRNDAARSWLRLGEAVQAFHAATPQALATLSPFDDTLDRGRRRIEHYDRELPGLLRHWERLSAPLHASTDRGLIHGDMNLSNVLWGHDVLVCDLEALCTGPRERDLAKLHDPVVGTYGPAAFAEILRGYQHVVDHAMLKVCIAANRVKAATWHLAECDSGSPSAQRSALVASLAASIRDLPAVG